MAYVHFVIHVQGWRITFFQPSIQDRIRYAVDRVVRSEFGTLPIHQSSTAVTVRVGGAMRAAKPPHAPPARPTQEGDR